MRVCRFDDDRVGLVDGDQVVDVTETVRAHMPAFAWPLPRGDQFIARLDALRPAMEAAARSGPRRPVGEVRLLSPVANPGKIVAAPVNYTKHFDEVVDDAALHHGNAIKTIHDAGVFLKATSSLIGAGEPVEIAWPERRTDHEIELAIIIGRQGYAIARDKARDHIAGFAIGLDMTVRGPEERSYRKSLDTFSLLGPWLVTPDEIADPNALELHLKVNGETRQRASTRSLILNCEALIEYASRAYTLYPGDVIMTGTPEGVSPIAAGDRIEASIEQIGDMVVAVGARGGDVSAARAAPALGAQGPAA